MVRSRSPDFIDAVYIPTDIPMVEMRPVVLPAAGQQRLLRCEFFCSGARLRCEFGRLEGVRLEVSLHEPVAIGIRPAFMLCYVQ